MKPSRGLLVVRPVETEESRGLIILVPDTRERMTLGQCEVLAVGAPAECDPTRSKAERKCAREHDYEINGRIHYKAARIIGDRRVHFCNVRVGDWLLVRPRAFIDGPEPEKKEWFVHQDDVIAILGRGDDSNA